MSRLLELALRPECMDLMLHNEDKDYPCKENSEIISRLLCDLIDIAFNHFLTAKDLDVIERKYNERYDNFLMTQNKIQDNEITW